MCEKSQCKGAGWLVCGRYRKKGFEGEAKRKKFSVIEKKKGFVAMPWHRRNDAIMD